jgi:hypothetical protein
MSVGGMVGPTRGKQKNCFQVQGGWLWQVEDRVAVAVAVASLPAMMLMVGSPRLMVANPQVAVTTVGSPRLMVASPQVAVTTVGSLQLMVANPQVAVTTVGSLQLMVANLPVAVTTVGSLLVACLITTMVEGGRK